MKFMLTQSYAPTEVAPKPITEWASEDAQAHIDFQVKLNEELTKAGGNGRAVPGGQGVPGRLPDRRLGLGRAGR